MPEPLRAAVLVSGRGSNLQALIDHFHSAPEPVVRVELVVASRPGVGALGRAARAGVPTAVEPAGGDERSAADFLLETLERHRVDLVVLAGYLRLIPAAVVRRYEGRMINVHPALLPAFGGPGMYGIRVHRAVLAAGARVSGATVHLVDEEFDAGRILAQWPVPVLADDTPESLAARVLAVEHRLLPLVIEALVRGNSSAATDPLAFELVPRLVPADASVRALLPTREISAAHVPNSRE